MRYCTALITTFAKSSFILALAVTIFKQATYLLSSTYYFFAKYISNVSHMGPHLKFDGGFEVVLRNHKIQNE